MKRFLGIMMIAAAIFSFVACDHNEPAIVDEPIPQVNLSGSVGAEGGIIEVNVALNSEYVVSCDDSWVQYVTTEKEDCKYVVLSVAPNTSTECRTTSVKMEASDHTLTLTLTQLGAEPEPQDEPEDPVEPVEPEEPDPDKLELSQTAYSIGAEGGVVEMKVNTNTDVAAAADQSWAKYVGSKAPREMVSKTLSFYVEPNTAYEERTVNISITAGDQTSAATIVQTAAQKPEDPVLSAGKSTYTVPAAGQDIVIDVTTNMDYAVYCDAGWITKVETKASRTDHITFTVAANKGEARSAKIMFVYGKVAVIVTVNQELYVAPAVLELSATEFNVTAAGEELSLDVTHNYDFTVSGNPSWVTVKVDGDKCSLKVDANTTTVERKASIVVKSKDLKKTVSIKQEAGKEPDPLDVGSNLSVNESANTYVVTKAGSYTFSAAVMGNGPEGYLDAWIDAQGWITDEMSYYLYPEDRESVSFSSSRLKNATAKIIWEDGDCIDGTPSYKSSSKSIAFKTNGKKGAALIGLYTSSGTILWSWLIWCTDRPEEFTFTNSDGDDFILMDRNLGATSAKPEDGKATFGYGFNFGRKDPIKMEYNMAKTKLMNNDSREYYTTVLNPTKYFRYVGKDIEYFNGRVSTITPDLWGDPYFPCAYAYRMCFDQTEVAELQKTIFDPCPPGYQVPSSRVFDEISISDVHLVSDLGISVDVTDGSTYFPFAGYGDGGDSHGQDNGWYGYPGFTNNGYREGEYCVKVWTATEGDVPAVMGSWLGGQAFSVSYIKVENKLYLIQHSDSNICQAYNEHCIRVRLQSVRCMRYVKQ